MHLVVCKCAKCDAVLGSLVNLWTQIGKRYITPVTQTQDDEPFHVLTSGTVRLGDADTLVGGCQLQDAECAKCRASLGQKCLTSPVNHVLHDGQIIFRTSSIALKSASDLRRKAEPTIKRFLKLKNGAPSADGHVATPPTPETTPFVNLKAGDSSSVDSPGVMQLQADLDAQRQDIHRIGSTGMQVVSNFETAIACVERQVHQLSESLDDVRKDGHGQRDALEALKSEVIDVRRDCQDSSLVSRLDQQLQTTDRTVTKLRQSLEKAESEADNFRKQLTTAQQELQEARDETARLKAEVDETRQIAHESVAVSKGYACEVSALKHEVKQLRAGLAKERAQPQPTAEPSSFSSHELDILASSISKIGHRASQVESLQMEFELFKSRVQRLEARPNMSVAASIRGCGTMSAEMGPRHGENAQPYYGGNTRKKRAPTGRDDAQNFDTTPPKRMAMSPSDFGSDLSVSYARPSDMYRPDPGSSNVGEPPPGPRRMRAGARGGNSTANRETWKTRG